MNDNLIKEPDPLTRYLNAGKTEKAPIGFTSKVMENVRLEAVPGVRRGIFQRIATIPVVSFIVIITLLLAALIFKGNQSDILTSYITSLFSNLKMQLPAIDLKPVLDFNLPEVMIWVIAGLAILSIFDRALQGFFQKEK
jgi:hypothetical protein